MEKRAAPKVQAKPKQAAVEEDGEEALLKTGEGWEAVKDAVQSLKAAGQWHPAGRGSRMCALTLPTRTHDMSQVQSRTAAAPGISPVTKSWTGEAAQDKADTYMLATTGDFDFEKSGPGARLSSLFARCLSFAAVAGLTFPTLAELEASRDFWYPKGAPTIQVPMITCLARGETRRR